MSRILKTASGEQLVDEFKTYCRFELNASVEKENKEEDTGTYIEPEEEILQEALKQAEEILNSARVVAKQVQQDAFEKGKQEGFEVGRKEGSEEALREQQLVQEEKFRMLEQQIEAYVKEMEIQKTKLLEEYIDDLKNIALAIGEKIVQVSLKSSSEVIEKMILAATGRLKKTSWAKIYVGKSGEQHTVNGDSRLLQELSHLSDNVKIIVMDDEQPGTCIIELPDEVIDISVGTQLENIKEIMNNARL